MCTEEHTQKHFNTLTQILPLVKDRLLSPRHRPVSTRSQAKNMYILSAAQDLLVFHHYELKFSSDFTQLPADLTSKYMHRVFWTTKRLRWFDSLSVMSSFKSDPDSTVYFNINVLVWAVTSPDSDIIFAWFLIASNGWKAWIKRFIHRVHVRCE